jgi:hypothetical protein
MAITLTQVTRSQRAICSKMPRLDVLTRSGRAICSEMPRLDALTRSQRAATPAHLGVLRQLDNPIKYTIHGGENGASCKILVFIGICEDHQYRTK